MCVCERLRQRIAAPRRKYTLILSGHSRLPFLAPPVLRRCSNYFGFQTKRATYHARSSASSGQCCLLIEEWPYGILLGRRHVAERALDLAAPHLIGQRSVGAFHLRARASPASNECPLSAPPIPTAGAAGVGTRCEVACASLARSTRARWPARPAWRLSYARGAAVVYALA